MIKRKCRFCGWEIEEFELSRFLKHIQEAHPGRCLIPALSPEPAGKKVRGKANFFACLRNFFLGRIRRLRVRHASA